MGGLAMLPIHRPKTAPLVLNETLLLARGGVRAVYRHPADTDKCLKIVFNQQRRRSARREITYLKKYSRRHGPLDYLPRFYGFCSTNLGRAAIFELIRDVDGQVSRSLAEYVAGRVTPGLGAGQIVELLAELHHRLLADQVIACDPAPANLLVQYRDADRPRLVLVDGIGNPHFIKIADFSKYYADKLINKKWRVHVVENRTLREIFAQAAAQGRLSS
jgi:hypothetical protein